MEILNSNPPLTDQIDFLISEHIRKISRLIETACEFYKIFKQKEIFSEISKNQISETYSEELNEDNVINQKT